MTRRSERAGQGWFLFSQSRFHLGGNQSRTLLTLFFSHIVSVTFQTWAHRLDPVLYKSIWGHRLLQIVLSIFSRRERDWFGISFIVLPTKLKRYKTCFIFYLGQYRGILSFSSIYVLVLRIIMHRSWRVKSSWVGSTFGIVASRYSAFLKSDFLLTNRHFFFDPNGNFIFLFINNIATFSLIRTCSIGSAFYQDPVQ